MKIICARENICKFYFYNLTLKKLQPCRALSTPTNVKMVAHAPTIIRVATRAYVRKDTWESIVKRVCIVKKNVLGLEMGIFGKI
jgi:hypothetical protein